MLQKLKIKNFQTHKTLLIDLSPTITTIVGRSDVGKSAIYRAIRWIATGLPKGNDFIRWGEKSTSVLLEVDKHKVVRKKGSSNVYQLDGKLFKALRTDIPDEIKGILNLSTINFQSQHDSPFWFAESAGEISRQLNAIVDLSLIDTSIKKAISKTRETKTMISYLETQVENAKKDVEAFGSLNTLRDLLEELEKAVAVKNTINTERDDLQILFHQALDRRKTVKALQPVVALRESLEEAWQSKVDITEERDDLVGLIQQVEKHEEILSRTLPSETELTKAVSTLIDLELEVNGLQSLINSCIARKERYKAWSEALTAAEEEMKTEFKGRCPLCGNPA